MIRKFLTRWHVGMKQADARSPGGRGSLVDHRASTCWSRCLMRWRSLGSIDKGVHGRSKIGAGPNDARGVLWGQPDRSRSASARRRVLPRSDLRRPLELASHRPETSFVAELRPSRSCACGSTARWTSSREQLDEPPSRSSSTSSSEAYEDDAFDEDPARTPRAPDGAGARRWTSFLRERRAACEGGVYAPSRSRPGHGPPGSFDHDARPVLHQGRHADRPRDRRTHLGAARHACSVEPAAFFGGWVDHVDGLALLDLLRPSPTSCS